MGEQNVKLNDDEATSQAFMKSLQVEVHALEKMLDAGLVESGIRREPVQPSITAALSL